MSGVELNREKRARELNSFQPRHDEKNLRFVSWNDKEQK
jgi:hypothetical protein